VLRVQASRTCHRPAQRRLLLSQRGSSEIRRSSLPLDLPSITNSTRPGSEASLFFQEVTKHMNPLPESDLSHRAEDRSGNGKETLGSSSLRAISPSNLGLDEADILPRKVLSASYKAPVHCRCPNFSSFSTPAKVDAPTKLQVFEPEAAPADGAVREFSSKRSGASASRLRVPPTSSCVVALPYIFSIAGRGCY
jgi:hypothetical protein